MGWVPLDTAWKVETKRCSGTTSAERLNNRMRALPDIARRWSCVSLPGVCSELITEELENTYSLKQEDILDQVDLGTRAKVRGKTFAALLEFMVVYLFCLAWE